MSSYSSSHALYLNQMPPVDPYAAQTSYPASSLGASGSSILPAPVSQQGSYYDVEPEINERYEGGGMRRDTWASESGWSGTGVGSECTFKHELGLQYGLLLD